MMREGKDITLVGWGAQLAIMEQACDEASKVCFFALRNNVVFRISTYLQGEMQQDSLETAFLLNFTFL